MTIADVIAAQAGHDGSVATPDGPRAGRPKRRTFSAEYKQRILEEYENAAPGQRGALLRREGLYSSLISDWRRARENAASGSLPEKKPGRPARDAAAVENERLRKENEKLAADLARTKAALEVVGKAHALLELLSESADSEKKRPR
jgi:transposase-like protein